MIPRIVIVLRLFSISPSVARSINRDHSSQKCQNISSEVFRMALVIVNGFCGDQCMDSYMASLLLCVDRGLEIGVPTFSGYEMFEKPPWELEDFFSMEFITSDKDRAWIFQHDSFPLVLKIMKSGFKWGFDKYQTYEINDSRVFIQHLKFSYKKHSKHQDGSECDCDHESNAEEVAGWKMFRYKLKEFSVCILTFRVKGRFSKPTLKRENSTRKHFETDYDQPKKKTKMTALIDAGPSGSSTCCLTGEAEKKLEEGQTINTLEDLNSSAKVSSDYLSHDEELKLKKMKNSDTQIRPSIVADPRPGPALPYNSYKHLLLPERLMGDFLGLAESNTKKNLETCGILGGSLKKGVYHITALIIPKQQSTSHSCETEKEGEILAVQGKTL